MSPVVCAAWLETSAGQLRTRAACMDCALAQRPTAKEIIKASSPIKINCMRYLILPAYLYLD